MSVACERAGLALGASMILGVAAWRVSASTYRADVQAVCEAERRSGVSMLDDVAPVSQWIRFHLATAEGQRLYAALRDALPGDRAPRLQAQANGVGLTSCPLADTYLELSREAAYRADLQSLCSYATFPGLSDLDDQGKIASLESWGRERATNPRTRALLAAVRLADTPAERARLLRAVAREIDVFTCDLAKIVETPVAPSCQGP